MSSGFERKERESASTNEERKKELRRVYRKLKGVRSQISMKMKELKKEVGDIDSPYDEDESDILDTDMFMEEEDKVHSSGNREPKQKSEPAATQFELKMLVDHKAKLRKRFRKLLDEVQSE
jgi:transposase